MLVIEGYSRKSLEVANYINSLENQDVLIITNDEIALRNLVFEEKNRVYITEKSNVSDIEDIIGLNNKFKHVVFYQNVKREDIDTYKNIEHVFDLVAVLTVQVPANEYTGEIKKYNA